MRACAWYVCRVCGVVCCVCVCVARQTLKRQCAAKSVLPQTRMMCLRRMCHSVCSPPRCAALQWRRGHRLSCQAHVPAAQTPLPCLWCNPHDFPLPQVWQQRTPTTCNGRPPSVLFNTRAVPHSCGVVPTTARAEQRNVVASCLPQASNQVMRTQSPPPQTANMALHAPHAGVDETRSRKGASKSSSGARGADRARGRPSFAAANTRPG